MSGATVDDAWERGRQRLWGARPQSDEKHPRTGEPDRVPGLPVTRAGGARAGEGAPLIKGEAFKNGDPLQNSRPLPFPSAPLSLFKV